MKNYTVSEVAEMFHTNPETVRRWIRDKKIEATQDSRKKGNRITETALEAFAESAPKYAEYLSFSTRTNLIAGGLISLGVVSALIAKNVIDNKKAGESAEIPLSEVSRILNQELAQIEEAIERKKENINQIKKELRTEEKKAKSIRDTLAEIEELENTDETQQKNKEDSYV